LLAGCAQSSAPVAQTPPPAPPVKVVVAGANGAVDPMDPYHGTLAGDDLSANEPSSAAPTDRPGAYTQVSLFGDLPGIPESERVSNGGPSLQQHTTAVEGACFDPDVSRDGKMLAFASTQHNVKPDIYIKPVGTATMTQLTTDPSSEVQPAFSPDGGKVAFASDRSGNWDIYMVDVAGTNLQQLTDDPAPEMHPSISADGQRLAYCRYNLRTREWELWVLNLVDGQRRYVTSGLFPRWSPTDSHLVYQRAKQRGTRWFSVWMIHVGADNVSMPTEIASSAKQALTTPRWSPDGKFIAYCAVSTQPESSGNRHQEAQIWIVRADGTGKMPITDPEMACFTPVWSGDGQIFFCANRAGNENVWSVLPMISQGSTSGTTSEPTYESEESGHEGQSHSQEPAESSNTQSSVAG